VGPNQVVVIYNENSCHSIESKGSRPTPVSHTADLSLNISVSKVTGYKLEDQSSNPDRYFCLAIIQA